MRKILGALLALLVVAPALAQGPGPPHTLYLPFVTAWEDCRMTSILRITDGQVVINLAKPANVHGWHLDDWTPAIADYKGGGVWQDSPLADGRRLTVAKWDLAIETMRLKATAADQDDAARELQEMRRLLEKAANYWKTEWQDEPVWIEARAACETNTRYALIHRGRIAGDDNYYRQPFLQPSRKTVLNNITLVLERDHWLGNEPGIGTAVELSAVETYDGRDLGNVDDTGTREPTTASEAFIANKRNVANITDVYHYDASTGAWSANLMDAALPYALLPAVPASPDAVFFGIDTSLANSGPFCSLVFDIVTAGTGYTARWEYWNGAWTSFGVSVRDNTSLMSLTGVRAVIWPPQSDWTTCNLNTEFGGTAPNITGYWVRMRVLAAAAPTPPVQGNRDVYSVIWPYIEIESDQVVGDLVALSRTLLTNRSTCSGDAVYRMIAGLRSAARGPSFTAYLNAADEQNPAGVTASVGANSTFVDQITYPAGRGVLYNPAGVEAMAMRARIRLSSTLVPHFAGTYHAFLRAAQVGGVAGDITLRLVLRMITTLAPVSISPTVPSAYVSPFSPQIFDLGQFEIPPWAAFDSAGLNLDIEAANANAAPPDLYIVDLILMPIDEWAADITDPTLGDSTYMGVNYCLDVDSITEPKVSPQALVKSASGLVLARWYIVSNGYTVLQSNAKQRLWYLFAQYSAGPPPNWIAPEFSLYTAQITTTPRYFSLRGAR